MKIFFRRICAFLSFWVCIYLTLYCIIPRKYYPTGDYKLQLAIFERIDSGMIKGNLLIGDSQPQVGLNAKVLNSTNLSMAGEAPVEGYYQLRQLLEDKTNHIDTVFLSYSIMHLISQNYFYKCSYYNQIINTKYLDSVWKLAEQDGDNSYSRKNSAFSTPLDKIINNPMISAKIHNIADFFLGGLNNLYEYFRELHSGKSDKELVNGKNQLLNGRLLVASSDTVTFIRNNGITMPDEELIGKKESVIDKIFLNKIIELLRLHNVKLVYILMPSPTSKAVNILQKQISELRQAFGDNFVYDSSIYTDFYFRDKSAHLNIRGINRFQTFLIDRLYKTAP